MPYEESPIVETTYFRWDGDPCRLHLHRDGLKTADLYRGGIGIVPIHPVDMDYAVEIGPAQYQWLVNEEIELNEDPRLKSHEPVEGPFN